jgi:murein DD-endopeptidase MepM/ murein hydrolase activator NlpD
MDDMPDHSLAPNQGARRVPLEQASGNHVTLDLGDGRFAFYEHLQSGSIRVRQGDRVRAGQIIARLGYSGSSSSGPHLHFHVADASSDLGAEGIPFVFTGFDHLGAFSSLEALVRGERWGSAAAGERRHEHPAAMAVLRFPP